MRSVTLWILLVAALLTGCQVLPDRPPPPALHDFGPPETRSAPWTAVSVEAPEWLHDPSIRYRLLYAKPTQVRFYSLDRWVAPPPDLFASRLAAHRSAIGYELKIDLQTLEQVFEQPGRSVVLLRFHAEAVHPQGGEVADERSFRLIRPTRSADAAGAVETFSLLVDQAVEELSRWLSGLPAPQALRG